MGHIQSAIEKITKNGHTAYIMSPASHQSEILHSLIFGRSEGSASASRAWKGDGATAARRGTPPTPGCSRSTAGSARAPGRGRPPTVSVIHTPVRTHEPETDPRVGQWR